MPADAHELSEYEILVRNEIFHRSTVVSDRPWSETSASELLWTLPPLFTVYRSSAVPVVEAQVVLCINFSLISLLPCVLL